MSEERRLVTILFADASGSTALGEALDPEETRALLARLYALGKEVVAEHGGTLEKFIGDAIMAVFGLPQAHGDDARRGLAAALTLRDRVRDDPVLRQQLPIRLGLDTGEVVATRDPSAGDFLVTGDPVNTAARLQQVAEPWTIICTERTARAAGNVFAFGTPAEVSVKGKRGPIRAVAVISPAATAKPRGIPFVGRDDDLAQLELVARRAFSERRPFLVSLVAPAGIGKTRLVEEFLDRLPRLAPAARTAIAQCLPYGQRLTYWPLRAVLFRLIDAPEDAVPESVQMAAIRWLERAGVDSPRRVAEYLTATVGLGEAQVADRDALLAAWRTAVEAASRDAPFVLVFEDLHWSSDSLLDLVEFVMQPRGDLPVVIVALTRPELLERRPAWGGGRRNYLSIALPPLDDTSVRELVKHLLGRSSPEIVSRIVERAEGNPFYAGEIVRTIVERLRSPEDGAAVEKVLATLPDTVQATVLARLDLLSAPERRALQLGSVFGRTFMLAGLTALDAQISGQLHRAVERLIDKDLLRAGEGDRFTFRHILIREVAYQTLPRAERSSLHDAAGRWLEGRAKGREDPLAELIAYHCREAALLSGARHLPADEAATVRRRAAQWLARAADVARMGAAVVEAGQHLRSAIEFVERGDLPSLFEQLGQVSWGNAGAEAYRNALRLCREQDHSPEQELRILGRLLMLYSRWPGTLGHRPADQEIAQLRAEGRALLQYAGQGRAAAIYLIADAFYPYAKEDSQPSITELEEADRSAQRALSLAKELGDFTLQSGALDAVGAVASQRNDWPTVIRAGKERLGFQDHIDLTERMDATYLTAWGAITLGDLDEVDRVTASALATLQPGQVPASGLQVATWRLYALTVLGRWDEVESLGDRARQLRIESQLRSTWFARSGFLAALDVARARRDEARVDQNIGILRDIMETRADEMNLAVEAYIAVDLDRIERVLSNLNFIRIRPLWTERALAMCTDHRRYVDMETARRAAEFAEKYGLRILEAQACRAIALAQEELSLLTRALRLFESRNAIPYIARTKCERALLTGDAQELAEGMRALETLGDIDQLARVEELREVP